MASKPCGACKLKKLTCSPDCIFAKYFPANEPMRFDLVHKIYGAEKVFKFLAEAPPSQREHVANAFCYGAEARKNDPIHGAYGLVLHYEHRLKELNKELEAAKLELASYVGADQVPLFLDIPVPEDFLTIPSALFPSTARVVGLNEAQGNQLVHVPTDAKMIDDGTLRTQDGASTSASVPSVAPGRNHN